MKIISPSTTVLIVKDFTILPYLTGFLFIAISVLLMILPPGSNFLDGIWSPDKPVPFWLGPILIVIGFVPLIFYKASTAIFDKTSNIFSIEWKSILGKKQERYYLNQIKEIILSIGINSTNTKGSVRATNSFNLSVHMQDNSYIILGNSSGSISINRINLSGLLGKGIADKGKKIAEFLNVPFQEIRPPSITEIVSMVSQVKENFSANQAPPVANQSPPISPSPPDNA